MMYLYLTNTIVFLIIGLALLRVSRRHGSLTFARDLGYSTAFCGLLPLGYFIHFSAPQPYREAGQLRSEELV